MKHTTKQAMEQAREQTKKLGEIMEQLGNMYYETGTMAEAYFHKYGSIEGMKKHKPKTILKLQNALYDMMEAYKEAMSEEL